MRLISVLCLLLCIGVVRSENAVCFKPLGDVSSLQYWSGLKLDSDDTVLDVPGRAVCTHPDGEKGWYRIGMARSHDGAYDWSDMSAVKLSVFVPNDLPVNLELSIVTAAVQEGSEHISNTFTRKLTIRGNKWHNIVVPFDSFDYKKARKSLFKGVKSFVIDAKSSGNKKVRLFVKDVEAVKAPIISLYSEIRSKPVKGGEYATYELLVSNCTKEIQNVSLMRVSRGREVMDTIITPEQMVINPGQTKTCNVTVLVSPRVAPGGREIQIINAVANGVDAGNIEFITLSHLEHPYIMHTQQRWDAVKQKIKDYDWAKSALKEYVSKADNWNVPKIANGKISQATNCEYLFGTREADKMLDVAVCYQLTGKIEYAEKCALFLDRLSDPQTGYPRTMQGCHQSLVQEGHFFQYIAMAYDIVYDSGVFTEVNRENIAKTFRLYQGTIADHIARGTTGNWQVSEFCGAIYAALAIGDMATVNYFLEGPGGFYDHISNGLMADGWWYECSIGYNTWVASEFTQLALALQPWGVNMQDEYFPATYSLEYNIPYCDVEARKKGVYGKPFQKYGPVYKPYVKIKDMWDALVPYADSNGVMFATNDSTEKKLGGQSYEIAYSVYKDPYYASIIKTGDSRDLIYGVGELPENTPQLGTQSAYSDNVGVAMLRSQTEGRDPQEQIQAVLKYGTHGGYHGHFDRTALNALMRYGRSFYNPEHIWYSYPNFMYAFFVQTSLPHNMVVVDMKQQEPVESQRLFFGEGEMIQATAVATNARWSNPPYGGLVYGWYDGTFQEKCWDEGRYMPVPENEPAYGSIGEYSDRVKQRRVMIVADDYVVLVDSLKADQEHTYDCLFNIKGFKGIEADSKKLTAHTESMNPDPVLAAQVITDCNWYQTTGTTKVSFETQFGKGADNEGTRIFGADGVLKMDVYCPWPQNNEVMIGTLPEAHWVSRKLWYSVKGDDGTLAEGKFGAWILGRDDIEVSLQGVDKLTLTTKAEFTNKSKNTLFWADAVIVTKGGKEIKLSELDLIFDKINDSATGGKDYYGGPIKISGRHFADGVPANPVKSGEEGTITVSLVGLNAVAFKASIGGDYPLGNEDARRKSLSFRSKGKNANFLTVIEAYESEAMVESVTATADDKLTVELVDGRVHAIEITGISGSEEMSVSVKESKAGNLLREEILK